MCHRTHAHYPRQLLKTPAFSFAHGEKALTCSLAQRERTKYKMRYRLRIESQSFLIRHSVQNRNNIVVAKRNFSAAHRLQSFYLSLDNFLVNIFLKFLYFFIRFCYQFFHHNKWFHCLFFDSKKARKEKEKCIIWKRSQKIRQSKENWHRHWRKFCQFRMFNHHVIMQTIKFRTVWKMLPVQKVILLQWNYRENQKLIIWAQFEFVIDFQ